MNQINNGGSAFPCQPLGALGTPMGELIPGMSLRDYFAAKAMSGFISNSNFNGTSAGKIPETAYMLADAMLTERDKVSK